MLPTFCTETITVLRAPTKEERGSSVRSWADAASHTVAGCSIQASSATGTIEEREGASETWAILAPPNADIRKGDRVECSAGKLAIVGEPYQVRGATGMLSHTVASAGRWDG